jgi:hypothetical protein
MRTIPIILAILFTIHFAHGQKYQNYTNDTLTIDSKFLKENINLNLHLPEVLDTDKSIGKYPITIIFDSQNTSTYAHIISSIDLLTSETQIPAQIVIGVPFNRQNRLYRTSSKKKENDELSGIERMERFLFDELIPKLKKEHSANSFLTIIGHSRTGFLVNYLTINQTEEINIAVSLSGFYNDEPLSSKIFKEYVIDENHFKNKLKYYFTAGGTLEELPYREQFEDMDNYFLNNATAENFIPSYKANENANHITNFWISIPSILIDAYADYNAILDRWFYDETKASSSKDLYKNFRDDFKSVSEKMGFEVNPNLTHIYSLSSFFSNIKKDYKSAIAVVNFGLELYPNELDFHLYQIEFYKEIGDTKMIEFHRNQYKTKVEASENLTVLEKSELLKNIVTE